MGPKHAKLLAQAVNNLLSAPSPGSVAFMRCLPSERVDALADSDKFDIPGWSVNAVIDCVGVRRITADQAVEQREDKAGATLLLVDPLRAGAGLDGIYSAGREIGEAELFKEALALARKPFWGHVSVLDEAIRRAERLGRRRRLTPWGKFDFYVNAVENVGRALARLDYGPLRARAIPRPRNSTCPPNLPSACSMRATRDRSLSACARSSLDEGPHARPRTGKGAALLVGHEFPKKPPTGSRTSPISGSAHSSRDLQARHYAGSSLRRGATPKAGCSNGRALPNQKAKRYAAARSRSQRGDQGACAAYRTLDQRSG